MADDPQITPIAPIDPSEDMAEGYTPDELAQAREEISKLSPSDYLSIIAYMNELEKVAEGKTDLPEAPSLVFTELWNPKTGTTFNLTIRGKSGIEVIRKMAETVKYAKARFRLEVRQKYAPGLPPAGVGTTIVTNQHIDTSIPPTIPAGMPVTQPLSPAPATTSAPATPAPSNDKKGTGVINRIVVTVGQGGKTVVQFHVGKFRYPFQDYRGAEVIAGLFDQDIGFTAEHLSKPAVYEPISWGGGNLYADWEKPDKYYNVLRVHR